MGSLLPTAQRHIAIVSSGYKEMTRLCLLQSHHNHVSMHPHLSSESRGQDQCELAVLAMSVTASYRTQGQMLDCSTESGHLDSPKVRGLKQISRSQVRAEGEAWPGQSQGSLRAMRPPACAWRGSTGKTKHWHVHWIQWPPRCWAGPNQSPAASPPPGLGCVRGSGRETFPEPESKCRPNTFF